MVIKGDIRIFPDEVKELLQGLAAEKFFADGILCGSWVMLVYRLHHKLVYALRTEDIDFAVETARHCAADIPDILKNLGYLPVLMFMVWKNSSRVPFRSSFLSIGRAAKPSLMSQCRK